MNTSIAGILELSLIFGSLFGVLVWELVALRRDEKRDKSARKK